MFRSFRPAAACLAALAAASLLGCNQKDASQGDASSAVAESGLPSTAGAPLPIPSDDPRAEFNALQQRLNGLQQQAMQDTVLQAAYAELDSMIEEKMAAADPQLTEHRARLQAIQGEMAAAQQAGEEEKFNTLLAEGTAIQGQLRQVQETTMAHEDVVAGMESFRTRIMAKMTEIDSTAPAMVERAEAISAQARAAMEGPPAAPGTEPEEE